VRRIAGQATLLLIVAAILRVPLFGNPVIHSDEQLYLLIGDRMWQGALPFVDIWDRKPVGLFCLYAAIRLLGGDGIIAYQAVATLFAVATALIVCRIAQRIAGPSQAVGAGVLYLIWLVIYDGAGGQAPVFYNLLVAGAAAVTVRAAGTRTHLVRDGTLAMALLGLAIQVKYTVALEGAAFGIAWLWLIRRGGMRWSIVSLVGLWWAFVALSPTLIAWSVYAAWGHSDAFVYANFLSVFQREADGSWAERVALLAGGLVVAAPLAAIGLLGIRRTFDRQAPPWVSVSVWVWVWSGVALLAILLVGTYKTFYFLPLVLPLTIAAAPGLDRKNLVILIAGGVIVAAALTVGRIGRRGTAVQLEAIVRLIGQRPPGCLFSYGSEPILYHLTDACLATPFVFRSHLGKTHESGALGVDAVGEVQRALATCPGVIVKRTSKDDTNPATDRLVTAALSRYYTAKGTVRLGRWYHTVYQVRAGGCGPRASARPPAF
jgi:hypothetical protein